MRLNTCIDEAVFFVANEQTDGMRNSQERQGKLLGIWTLIFVFQESSKIESTSSQFKLLSEQWLSNWMDLKAISQPRWSLQDKLPCRNHDTSCCMIYLAAIIMIRLILTISHDRDFISWNWFQEPLPELIWGFCSRHIALLLKQINPK